MENNLWKEYQEMALGKKKKKKKNIIPKRIHLECLALLVGRERKHHPSLSVYTIDVRFLIKFPLSGLNKAVFCCLLTWSPKHWRKLHATKLPQQK